MRQSETCLREVAAILRCDLSLIISDFEFELFKSEFGVPRDLMQVNRLMACQLETASQAHITFPVLNNAMISLA